MTSIITKSFAAIALLAAASPALAATEQTTTLRYDAKTGRYCLTEPAATGSHIQKTFCKTTAQWAAAGLTMPQNTQLAAK